MRNTILVGDVREKLRDLPDESVHCVVTSPPYWGLRDYGTPGQLGLEATPEEYVANIIDLFREVRRVLRKDGTLWLNLGDTYASSSAGQHSNGRGFKDGPKHGAALASARLDRPDFRKAEYTLKPKDIVGIPWRVAFALQADGWWLRSDIVWAKPNPMPESVTDRPTKAHEYLFLLSKAQTYYYDSEAIREPHAEPWRGAGEKETNHRGFEDGLLTGRPTFSMPYREYNPSGRNARTVWEIATEPYSEAHFATYPTALVKRCILAGTSEHGCCSVCGAPWRRVVEKSESPHDAETASAYAIGTNASRVSLNRQAARARGEEYVQQVRTVGWQPSCKHEAPVDPAIVLDPFMGSGTTALVALTAFRDYVGIELNPAYVEMAERRIAMLKDQGRLL